MPKLSRPSRTLVSIRLPLPPSVNQYWFSKVVEREEKKPYVRQFVTHKGKKFQRAVKRLVLAEGADLRLSCRLAVSIYVTQKTRRACDLDNFLKPLLDALEHANVFENDSQIDKIITERVGIHPEGAVDVSIVEYRPGPNVVGVRTGRTTNKRKSGF